MPTASNEEWIRDLSQPGERREERLGELRSFLVAGLRKGLAGRFPADHSLLDDFAQEALLKVLERLHSFRGESRFTTWALSVALRVSFSELRRRHWRDVSLEDVTPSYDRTPAGLEEAGDSSERATRKQEILTLLYRAIDEELTERQRQVLLAQLNGMPLEVVAEKLRTKRNALYKVLHDARLKLRKGLENALVPEEEVRWAFDL